MIQVKLSHVFFVALIFVLAYLLSALSAILLPFVLGFALAYFLDPLADRLEDIGLRRSLATLTITFIVGLGLLPAIVFGLPALAAQITTLIGNLPGYILEMQAWLATQNLDAGQTEIVNSLSDALLNGLQATASGLLLSGLSLINLISLMFITPIVAIYMLNDWDRMVARVDHLLPDEHTETVRFLAHEIDDTLGGFARGQSLVCLALGTVYAVGLWAIGLEGAVIVGLLAGLVSFVPYVGAACGMVLAGGLGLGQFGLDWWPFMQMAVVFVFGQFIEGNFLTPRLVGDRVRLHPVWIIFALLAMGTLFGFLGLLLAVPIAAILGVLVRHAVTLYERDYVKRVDG